MHKRLIPLLLSLGLLIAAAYSNHHVNLHDDQASPAAVQGVRQGDTITWTAHEGEFTLTFADLTTVASVNGKVTVTVTPSLYGPYTFQLLYPGYVGNGGGEVHPLVKD